MSHRSARHQSAFAARENYGPSRTPSPEPTAHDRHLQAKSTMCHQLSWGQMSNLPGGFPFRYLAHASGEVHISYTPYEFKQKICLSRPWEPRVDQLATISYEPPSHINGRYYTWKISLPSPSRCRGHMVASRIEGSKIVCAEVRVDGNLPQSGYFVSLRDNPEIICRALAISLEYDVLLEIRLLDIALLHALRDSVKGRNDLNLDEGDIIYIATTTSGHREIMLVLDDQAGFAPKYSATG